ncbi:molecular chaperone HtpG [Oleidesulfovibrio sp.]|uniref:molecular chaperone HtpG n=1 Tax=Oleidesulfovibrio sp. TaxID=2909707 RepID=UPI003A86821B
MSDTQGATTEKHEFRTEVRKLLHIITHSLYTNREIFLRELVSNASDALDKLRFAQARSEQIIAPELDLNIAITVDEKAKTLTITDTGIGMTRQELIDNLGTIASSGSERFLKELADKGEDAGNIIGRFGVGFYAVFMVADTVRVTSRSARSEQEAWSWTSDGLGSFELEEAQDAPERGTRIVAHLKEDAAEFLKKDHLKQVIRRHSNFIPFPISVEGEHVNTTPALWREPKFQVTKEQYKEFYTFLTFDSQDPLDTIHLSIDAPVQFTSLVFVPTFGNDMFGYDRDKYGLDLYVRRVLISREYKALIPEYLSFLKGVVDTEDLPLNISRETLQENALIAKIRQTLVKQVLSHLDKLASSDAEKYAEFWRTHGRIFRMGYNDYVNREKFIPLLRFNSSVHEDDKALCSLDEYIERAREGQKHVWYVSAPNREAARLNPHVEIFRRKGIEVLYMYEAADEFIMESLGKWKEFEFRSVEHADADILKDFDDVEKKDAPEALDEEGHKTLSQLLTHMKNILGDRVEDVRESKRLSDSPACLASKDGGMTASMEKLMRVMNKDDSIPRKVLEVNPDHMLIRNMLRLYRADADDRLLQQATEQLFESALLLEGYLQDPHALVGRVNNLLEQATGWYAEVRKL